MMNWSASWKSLIRSLSFLIVLLSGLFCYGSAQQSEKNLLAPFTKSPPLLQIDYNTTLEDTTNYLTQFPDPTSVLYKSMILPGWGQVINDQIWKVPIVYALLGGLTAYSIYLTKRYHDYRAAYYNLNEDAPDDFRFGRTPAYISPTAGLNFLRETRNSLNNRRDFIYVTIALAYGLNILDAYVFAHLRSFNVSEDLSANATIKPTITARYAPALTISIELH